MPSSGNHPKPARRRALRLAALCLLSALFVAGIAGRDAYSRWLGPVRPGSADGVRLTVRPGATTADVATLLQERGLVRSALLFRYYVRRAGADGKLRPGRYVLSPGMGMDRLLTELELGQPENNSFTLPEGYTLAEIAQVLAERGFISSAAAFTGDADRSNLAAPYLPPDAPVLHRLEGYLFPDTYQVDPGATDQQLLELLVRHTEQELKPEYRRRAAQLGLSVHQLLTLASIVEAEARLDSERPIIAGVYESRLRQGMRLDADPTVRYFRGKKAGEPLTEADLQAESPFNTYLHQGLPPGPICNPGDASIQAALHPADTPYLYFVAKADGSGAHVFSRTLEEHNRNVQEQLQAAGKR